MFSSLAATKYGHNGRWTQLPHYACISCWKFI